MHATVACDVECWYVRALMHPCSASLRLNAMHAHLAHSHPTGFLDRAIAIQPPAIKPSNVHLQ